MSLLSAPRLLVTLCSTIVLAATAVAVSVPDAESATPPYGTTAIPFSSQLVGTTSRVETASVTNPGSTPIVITTSIDGPGAANFVKGDDTCSRGPVSPGRYCTVSVTFAPRSAAAFAATLSFSSGEWSSPYVVPLTGIGVPPADLKVLGPGVNYSGGYQLVTRTVPSSGSGLMVHKLGILNEDTVVRSYGLRLTSSGAPATAEVWTTGYGAKVLAKDASGMFIPPPVAPGKVLALDLRVTPTTPGQHVSHVDVDLISEHGGQMERVSTETNTPAPAKGTWEWEMTARQGGQPFVGGQGVTPTVTAPALNVGQSAVFTVRLKNDGTSPARIPLWIHGMDTCSDFSVVVRVGATDITAAADRGDYLTPLRQVGQYTDVTVVTKRVAKSWCRNAKVTAITPYLHSGLRGIYLLTNAAYAAATD